MKKYIEGQEAHLKMLERAASKAQTMQSKATIEAKIESTKDLLKLAKAVDGSNKKVTKRTKKVEKEPKKPVKEEIVGGENEEVTKV